MSLPQWLFKPYIYGHYTINVYTHPSFGLVYKLSPKMITYKPINWYNHNGQLIYQSPGIGFGPYSSNILLNEQNWRRNIKKIKTIQ